MLAVNLRKTAKDLSNSPLAFVNNISEREAYYRKIKLLKKEAIIPMPYWQDDIIYTVRIEVICNKKTSHLLISAARECTSFYYGLTSEGIILFLNVPLPHMNMYAEYFKSLLINFGDAEYRFTLSRNWGSGRSLMDIVEDWNYGPKGFTTKGLDISANIFDYI